MKQRGDTVIEVMLAFSVFAMVAVGAIAIMNHGLASAQQSLETTLVRQQMDGQAEALRYLHGAYSSNPEEGGDSLSGQYASLVTKASGNTEPSPFGAPSCTENIPDGKNVFILDPENVQVKDGSTDIKPMSTDTDGEAAPAYAQLMYVETGPSRDFLASYGMWIEPIEGLDESGTGQGFIDYHIRACWYSTTSDTPRTLGTIVRLYTPKVN